MTTPGERVVLGNYTTEERPRPLVMGVLNVTPDSFSDGGRFFGVEDAVTQFHRMVEDGADVIDIGGESSRPGAEPIDVGEEWRRIGPILTQVAASSPVPISIDTYKAEIARRAAEHGAAVINDISALRFDPEMAEVVAGSGTSVILMHMQGTPRNMQKNPVYNDVVHEICGFLSDRARAARRAGIAGEKIILDPGIGFGKTLTHNLLILRELRTLVELGYPVLVGASRKSFIGKVSGVGGADRLEGSLAAAVLAASAGARILRVHDVCQTKRALEVWAAVLAPERYAEVS
jgi:dihydropteroate synthase